MKDWPKYHYWVCLYKIKKHISNWWIRGTGKSLSDVLIYLSINPQYSIPLLGRFPSIIHQKYISRTSTVQILFWFSRSCILKVIVPRSQIGSQMGACFLWKVQGNKIKQKKNVRKNEGLEDQIWICWLAFLQFQTSTNILHFYEWQFNTMTLERLLSNSAIPRLYLLGSSSHFFLFTFKNNLCTQHVLNLYFSCTELGNHWTICRHIVG